MSNAFAPGSNAYEQPVDPGKQACYDEIEAIQARMFTEYSPRPGETWKDAAEAVGTLRGRVIGALQRALGHGDIHRLNRDELEQLIALLEKTRRGPGDDT